MVFLCCMVPVCKVSHFCSDCEEAQCLSVVIFLAFKINSKSFAEKNFCSILISSSCAKVDRALPPQVTILISMVSNPNFFLLLRSRNGVLLKKKVKEKLKNVFCFVLLNCVGWWASCSLQSSADVRICELGNESLCLCGLQAVICIFRFVVSSLCQEGEKSHHSAGWCLFLAGDTTPAKQMQTLRVLEQLLPVSLWVFWPRAAGHGAWCSRIAHRNLGCSGDFENKAKCLKSITSRSALKGVTINYYSVHSK